jgi:hypothetical protein
MALIALLAVEMAALRVASYRFVDLSRHLTVAALAVATYLARYRDGGRAAGWFGFALAGWSYFGLVIDASARADVAGSLSLGTPLPPIAILRLFMSDDPFTGRSELAIRRWWNEYEILQSMLTLIVASLGGLIFWMWARRRGAPYRQEESRSGKLDLDDRTE